MNCRSKASKSPPPRGEATQAPADLLAALSDEEGSDDEEVSQCRSPIALTPAAEDAVRAQGAQPGHRTVATETELSEPEEPYEASTDELVDTTTERVAAGLCSRSVPAQPGSWALPGASRGTTFADEVRALLKQDSWQMACAVLQMVLGSCCQAWKALQGQLAACSFLVTYNKACLCKIQWRLLVAALHAKGGCDGQDLILEARYVAQPTRLSGSQATEVGGLHWHFIHLWHSSVSTLHAGPAQQRLGNFWRQLARLSPKKPHSRRLGHPQRSKLRGS